jgi:conjugal transfer ATP-binding protein TraC
MYLGDGIDVNQFHDTYIITLNLTRESKKFISSVRTALGVMHGQRQGDLCTLFNEKKKEAVPIIKEIDSGTPLFRMDLNIFISGNNLEEAKANAATIQSFWKKGGLEQGGFILDRLNYIQLPSFLASLPLCISSEYFEKTKKYTRAFSRQAAHFFPIEADMQGNVANIILMSRRGRIAGIDIFGSETNKNALILAESGAGKSMFVNYLALCSYSRGDKVFIIDVGRSYEKLCKTFNGQFIELMPERPMSFNPFTDIKTSEQLFDELDFLASFIYTLGASRNASKSEEDAKFIEQHIQAAIKYIFSKSDDENPMTITDVRDYLAKESDKRLRDFAVQMGSFCKGGVFGAFFDGPNEINFDKDIVVLEIDGIDNLSADIRDAIISVFIYKVSQYIYIQNIELRRTLLVIDEAHKFIGKDNRKMDLFVEQAYRRFRKHNGAICMATQGFGDIYNKDNPALARLGTSIVDNSKWTFFFQQKPSSIDIIADSAAFKSLGDLNIEILRSLDTKKGEYSELAVYHDGSLTPFRFVANKFIYYLLTTDPDDKQKINELINMKGYSLVRAIKELAGELQ